MDSRLPQSKGARWFLNQHNLSVGCYVLKHLQRRHISIQTSPSKRDHESRTQSTSHISSFKFQLMSTARLLPPTLGHRFMSSGFAEKIMLSMSKFKPHTIILDLNAFYPYSPLSSPVDLNAYPYMGARQHNQKRQNEYTVVLEYVVPGTCTSRRNVVL